MTKPLLEIKDLRVSFRRDGDLREVVHGVNLSLLKGQTLGIVGESGSGKSVSTMAVMHLLPKTALVDGSILFDGEDIAQASEERMRQLRGRRISMIFQEPMTALNPVRKCGPQVVEMLRLHERLSAREAKARVLELFQEVLLPRPEKIFNSYPHEISGGQKQRVMIAMALICNPDIIIADEPTTALDVTVQNAILQLLRRLQQQRHISIIFITHDLGVIAQIADQVAVMYQGEIVEQGAAQSLLHQPQHPYTKGLLACRPPLDSRPLRLPTVQDYLSGNVPDAEPAPAFSPAPTEKPLLSVRSLSVEYPLKKNLWGRPTSLLKAVDDISFEIHRGETLGLVGESGCGKTTLGRSLLRLIQSSSGQVEFDGMRLDAMSPHQMRSMRTRLQIIFQDPYSSLNPRITIGEAIMEPLRVHHIGSSDAERRRQVLELMGQVGLQPEWFDRYPHEFSGGQRQRVCIARALVLRPELVICDESVSALDVSVQAQVLNLLNELKRQYGFTYLFITHDLSVVKFLSDRIMVMRQGRLVELQQADDLFRQPESEYTQNLLAALPRI